MRVPGISAILTLLLSASLHRAEPTLAITHVAIIDVRTGTTAPDRTVLIRGRKVVRIAAGDEPIPTSTQQLDGRGKYLIPGLWDMHVHLSESDLRALVALGITGARDMGGNLDELLVWRAAIAGDPTTGPRLVFAGPVLRGPQSDTDSGSASAWVIRSPEEGVRAVDSLLKRGADFIKVHEGLSRAAYFAIGREAQARHRPFVGHVPASLTPIEVSDAGQQSIEHLEFVPDSCLGIFAPVASRAALPAQCNRAGLDSIAAHLERNGTWLDPTLGSFRVFAARQFPAILAGFKDLVPLLRARHIRLLAGTDLGSSGIIPGASLHDELGLLVDAGYTPLEALRAATINPAGFLGLEDSLGTIEPGKLADLVLLSADPLRDIRNTRTVIAVIRDGRVNRILNER